MLKYIVAAFVVIAVWVAWALFLMDVEMAILIPIGVTLLVVVVLVAIVVARRLRARRAARELEKALAAQAAEQARSARPDMQAEVLQMQQEFQRAIQALKSSRLGKGGDDALYALPWHVLIGPPGSGKSTALRNSGLQFPYMSTSGGGVRGVGGTRNCDWWLTNEGVLLDTAGRWTTEEEDRNEWLGFLDLIKRFRPQKPLNGVVATISLDQLGGAHEEEVAALARRMRERVDEVQNRLQMSLPVYVLFTKADLIPGFVETFNDLSKQERGQIWGFTVPVTGPPVDPGMHFSERFEELTSIVEKRSLRRMGEERKIESRELIHSFPQQLVTLKKNCQDFVAKLYETSHFGQTPMFRGVYFSSGTQEGRPIDRVMHKMAEAFGIRSEVHLGEPVTEAKSYFLRDVFLRVVFPDEQLAMRSRAELARQRRNQFLAAGVIGFTALAIAALPAIAFVNNRSYMNETEEIVDDVSTAAREDGPLSPDDLRPLQRRVAEMERYDRRAPVFMSMGLYQDEVFDPLQRYYQSLFRAEVVRPIFQSDLAELDDFGRRYQIVPNPPTGPEHTENYDRLRAHLLLTRPRAEIEPELSDDDNENVREWLGRRIARQWGERIEGGNIDDDMRQEVRRQSDQYVTLLALEEENDELAPEDSIRFPRDDEAVLRARQALTRVSLTDMALERLIAEVEDEGYDLRLVDLIGNTVNPMRSFDAGIGGERVVRGAFTARGWENRVRDMLYEGEEGNVFGEAWVLGSEAVRAEQDAEAREDDLCQLRDQYFRAYVQEWLTFLRSVNVTMRRENDLVLADLQDLTRGAPEPYRLLFQQTLHNTMLNVPGQEDNELAEGAGQSAWERFWNWVGRNRYGRVANEIRRDMEAGDIPIEPDDDCDHLDPRHVFVAFEGFTRVGATPPPPPPPEGQEPAPAPPVPLDTYEEQLHTVRDSLQAHLQTPEGTGEALDTALATARTSTYALIESQELGWRPLLQQLMLPPIEGSVISVATGGAGAAGRSWCTEVYSPYHRNILGGYPINPSGHDVPLDDFAAFYAPEGTLWAFYNEVLDRHAPREGDTFSFSTRLGRAASSAYRTELLQYLERAHDVTATMFPPGSEEPLVEFDVRIQPSVRLAIQEFCVSGTCYEHHNGPERWIRMAWPGEDPVAGATLDVRGEDGIHERIVREGEWGLYRLMEEGTVVSTSRGRRVFTMSWRLRDHQVDVTIDFRPVRGDAPFFGVAGRERNPAFLAPLRGRHIDPPQQIASSRNTCRVVGATVEAQQ